MQKLQVAGRRAKETSENAFGEKQSGGEKLGKREKFKGKGEQLCDLEIVKVT